MNKSSKKKPPISDHERFCAKAVREAERRLQVPPGWWGTWLHVQGPNGVAVRFAGNAWILRQNGVIVSKHDSRPFAISKGRKLGAAGR
jgi:hypothetical protein